MKKTVEELKKELLEAEKAQQLESLYKELEAVEKEYGGKCFGSHTFQRRGSHLNMGAVHYERFYIREDKIYVLERTISISRNNNYWTPSKIDFSYTRHHYERCVTDDKHSVSYNVFHGYSFFREEISFEKFEQLWAGSEECALIVKGLFETHLPHIEKEWIAQGDAQYEQSIEDGITELGLDVIDFTKYPKIHHHLKYATLPMFHEHRWMPRMFARQVLQYYIKKLEKTLDDPWTIHRVREALRKEIYDIKEFIDKEL